MISLLVMIPMGTVPKGRLSFCLFCIGIRRMVNNQLPSVSVRGRSSVSAISLRNDSGTLRVLSQKFKVIVVWAYYVYPAVRKPLRFFHKAGFTIKICSHLIASFRLFTRAEASVSMALFALINTISARSRV